MIFGCVSNLFGVSLEETECHFVAHAMRDVCAEYCWICLWVVFTCMLDFVFESGLVNLNVFFARDFGKNEANLCAHVRSVFPAIAELLMCLLDLGEVLLESSAATLCKVVFETCLHIVEFIFAETYRVLNL